MTNCYKQNTTDAQTNKTTKSNIQKHLKSGTHIFANLFLMPGITPAFCWISWCLFDFGCFLVGSNSFLFICRWFAWFFPVPGLGLAGATICLFAKVWERINHKFGQIIFIVLFHFDCDVVSSYFVILFRTVFICFMSNLWVVSQRLSVNTSAGPCAQGFSGAWSKDQGK